MELCFRSSRSVMTSGGSETQEKVLSEKEIQLMLEELESLENKREKEESPKESKLI
jgi:hypothetical protein